MSIVESIASALEEATERPLDGATRGCLVRGLRTFVRGDFGSERLLDALIETLDADVSHVLDAILHHPRFQALESAWRGLSLLVTRVPPGANVQCDVLNCSKEDLWADFEDSPEIPKSGLHKILYSGEYGPFGGRPYAVVFANYQIEATRQDIVLLTQCAQTAARALAVFITGAHPSLLGRADSAALAVHGPDEAKTQGQALRTFRELPAARFVGLIAQRTLGRDVHTASSSAELAYAETIAQPNDRLWQSAGFGLATCLARSFAQFRMATHITGPIVGALEDLPTWSGPRGDWPQPSALDVPVSPAQAEAFVQAGVMPFTTTSDGRTAYCLAAPSCLAPSAPRPASLPNADWELHRSLPAVLLMTRLGMYMKVMHREAIGTWREPDELRHELLAWFHELGADAKAAAAEGSGRFHSRTSKPFRAVELTIVVPPEARSYFLFQLRLVPNWSVDGRFVTLAIDGLFDRE